MAYNYDWSKLDTNGRIYIHKTQTDEGVYRGQHKATGREKNLYDGVGTFLYTNGNVYEGNWRNGLREGHGRLVYANGSSYVG